MAILIKRTKLKGIIVTITVALWIGGIVVTAIFGLIGYVWKTNDKKHDKTETKLDKYDDRIDANTTCIATMKNELSNVKAQQIGHSEELKALTRAITELAAAQGISTTKYDAFMESYPAKLEAAMLKVGAKLQENFREALDQHTRDSRIQNREDLEAAINAIRFKEMADKQS